MVSAIYDILPGTNEAVQPVTTPTAEVSTKQAIFDKVKNPSYSTAFNTATAAGRYAAVSREQWDNYKKFGYPIENELVGMVNNEQLLNRNIAAASGLAKVSGKVAASETRRRLSGYGLGETAAQKVTNRRLNNLATTANIASARDYVRSDTLDRNRQILVGGAPNDGLQDL